MYFISVFQEPVMNDSNVKLVYSDDPKKIKKNTEQSKKAPGTGKAVMRIEKKGRGGKSVTLIERLAVSDDELKKICKELKSKCGTGGTVKDHHIEIQGDFREKIRPLLEQKGYKV